jgi:hypothetical protein
MEERRIQEHSYSFPQAYPHDGETVVLVHGVAEAWEAEVEARDRDSLAAWEVWGTCPEIRAAGLED